MKFWKMKKMNYKLKSKELITKWIKKINNGNSRKNNINMHKMK